MSTILKWYNLSTTPDCSFCGNRGTLQHIYLTASNVALTQTIYMAILQFPVEIIVKVDWQMSNLT